MVIIFLNFGFVLYQHAVFHGETVTGDYYKSVSIKMWCHFQGKRQQNKIIENFASSGAASHR